jgi:predicted solute-binding protein
MMYVSANQKVVSLNLHRYTEVAVQAISAGSELLLSAPTEDEVGLVTAFP